MEEVMDSVQNISVENWRSRLKNSLGGVCFGLILFIGAFPLIYWNEGRAVDRYETLNEAKKQTTSIPANQIDPGNEGKLIHFTAVLLPRAGVNLTDPIFQVTTSDLILERNVEIFQWQEKASTETRKNVGGSQETVTTYSYYQAWASNVQNSQTFHEPSGHRNPDSMRIQSAVFRQEHLYAGKFVLPPEALSHINWFSPFVDYSWNVSAMSKAQGIFNTTKVLANHRGFFVGINISSMESQPSVGDLRVTFESVKPAIISVLAQQEGNTFVEWTSEKERGSIFFLKKGNLTAQQMLEDAEGANAALTLFLRLLSFLIMGCGLYLVLRPIEVFADVVPMLGDVVGCGICLVAFVLSFVLSSITISIAWLIHHPLVGGIVLATTILISVGVSMLLVSFQARRNVKETDENTPDDRDPVEPTQSKDGDDEEEIVCN